MTADCKVCIKGHRCDSHKAPKNHSANDCFKTRKCDACASQRSFVHVSEKTLVVICTAKKGKCADCEELPPKEGALAVDPSLDLSKRPS